MTSAQNVYFSDADSPWAYHIGGAPDSSYDVGGTDDASLAEFLSRPVKIATYQWTPEAQLFQGFNPWKLYFADPKVIQKLSNFRNFRCTLCIKVMLNGNSFYYGRALLSYNPLLIQDDVTLNRAFFEQDIVGASQKPHVLLDPCSSQGAEMCLPFIFPENWFDITTSNWEDVMGECIIHDFSVLKHANGGTDPVTVNIFAWAENCELCIPTSLTPQSSWKPTLPDNVDEFGYPRPMDSKPETPPPKPKKGRPPRRAKAVSMTPATPFKQQSEWEDELVYDEQAKGPPKKTKAKGKGSNVRKKGNNNNSSGNSNNNNSSNDEFKKDGLISKPATAIASAANALSMIPVIAPYAKATAMVATKVGQIAKLFGYSRPQIMTDISTYVPRYTGNLTNTDSPEALQKLSVDAKNELTIDSRVTGMDGSDEMTIHSIVSRESYLTQFDWAESAVTDTFLFSAVVTPTHFRTLIPAAPVEEIHQTALSFGSLPFRYWQGTIKFRFQIVCSEYHRGRLRIVYDPNILTDTSYNATYSTIIDIAEERDFEYEVKWVNVRQWQKVPTITEAKGESLIGTTTPLSPNPVWTNGTLNVYVVNELATPSMSAADVKVLVWCSAGDDYAVSVPRSFEGLNETSYFQQQSRWSDNKFCPDCGQPWTDCDCYSADDEKSYIMINGFPYSAQAEEQMAVTTDDSNIPVEPDPVNSFGDSPIMDDNQYLIYQGERVLSFRDLLRRYHFWTSLYASNVVTSSTGIMNLILQNFPAYRGFDPNGSSSADQISPGVGVAPYNYTAQTLLNYLTPAYVCRRGSLRRKYVYNGPIAGGNASATVTRQDAENQNLKSYADLSTSTGVNNGQSQRSILMHQLTGSGAQVTPLAVNPVLEVEFPFYTQGQRFTYARDIRYNVSRAHPCHTLTWQTNADVAPHSRFDVYVSTGEDFSLSMFVGAPVMYVYTDPPSNAT